MLLDLVKFIFGDTSLSLNQSNEKREKELDGSLEAAIFDTIESITENISEAQEYCTENISVKLASTSFKTPRSYKNLPITELKDYLLSLQPLIKNMKQELADIENEHINHYDGLINEQFKELRNGLKDLRSVGLLLNLCDSWADFENKNKNSRLFSNNLEEENKELAKDIIERIKKAYEYIETQKSHKKEIQKTLSTPKSLIISAKNELDELITDMSLINELKNNVYEKSDIEIDNILTQMINGYITRSRALKTIKEKKPEPTLNIHVNKTDITQKMPEITREYKKEIYAEQELRFFTKRGIKVNDAKEIIDNSFLNAKEFIESTENLFKEYKIDAKEIYSIFQMNERLMKEGSISELIKYKEKISSLLDVFDPSKISGILPKHLPDIYKSSEALENFIDNSIKIAKNIHFHYNHTEIKNPKDMQTFEGKVTANPLKAGKHVIKYKMDGFKTGTKTDMYKEYSKIAGEGLFIKVKLGDKKRVVYKITNNGENVFNVYVISYFDVHKFHTEFYRNKK